MDTKFIDWHTADIIAALRKKGTSLAAESPPWTEFFNAGKRPDPPLAKGELIIATALDTHPWVIWPSRYHDPITHEFIDRTRMIRQRKERIAGIRFLTGTATPVISGRGCRNDYSPFTRSILAPSARSLSSIRS
jgi:Ner family transcriptional regulator